MDHKSENIDKYFREHLTDFEQSPPEASWDTITQKLGHKRKKRAILLIFRIAAGMALLLSTGIGYYLLTKTAGRTEPSEMATQHDGNTIHEPSSTDHVPDIGKKSMTAALPVRNLLNEENTGITDANTTEQFSASKTTSALSHSAVDAVDDPEYQFPSMTLIELPGKVSEIPVSLPPGLNYNPPTPERSITPEEATALLLADYVEPDAVIKDRDKWALGSEVAPLYSHRSITSDYERSSVISDLNESESGLFAYAGGVRVAFSPSKRLSVQSGVYYSRYGQELNKVEAYTSKNLITNINENRSKMLAVTNSTGVISGDFIDNSGYEVVIIAESGASTEIRNLYSNSYGLISTDQAGIAPFEETDVKLTQYFDYFELPLLLKYKLIDRKIDFSFSGGVVTNILIGSTITQQGENTHVGETSDITQVNYLGSIGMGLEYPIISGFAITLEPRFRYYFNPIDKVSQYDVHPYSFGIFAGISYSF